MNKKINRWVLLVISLLLSLFIRALFFTHPTILPSALIGKNLPAFQLPNLLQPTQFVTEKNVIGQATVLHVWATWCEACRLEHPMLMKIKEQYHVPLIGILYKDDAQQASFYLQKEGNPYALIGNDQKGDLGIDLGIYGTPETFIISQKGKIVYRHVGVIEPQTWKTVLYPLVRQYSEAE